MIRIGRLLPGCQKIREGQHQALKGFASLMTSNGDYEEVVVFAKELSSREISTEVICAALGRALSIPIPEPVVLFDENNKLFFASVDAAYPSLAQYVIDSTDSTVMEKLTNWPILRDAALFDELIAMGDRHDGNLLFNGEDFILIDHENAIPPGLGFDQWGVDYYLNQLLDVVKSNIDPHNEIALQATVKHSRDWADAKKHIVVDGLKDQIPDSLIDAKTQHQMLNFLALRIGVISHLLYQQIKPMQTQMNFPC
ncbi:hypothetical protein RA178_05515 [Shewanella oncorhynchi]|uniref:Uncharacterized protein n=1 Tax=Shewanella oncorhynchi TaxID=2726434 RepID=A0AA50KFF3_9GAMM|nr:MULTISPECIES: hypothetical protein [Shewanella]WMB74075.1 hypothetical protein RA178_05515 [Shewanella oncorhynchi]SUI52383.1 Uncharacterised protein [Shewanella baltica]